MTLEDVSQWYREYQSDGMSDSWEIGEAIITHYVKRESYSGPIEHHRMIQRSLNLVDEYVASTYA